MLGIRISKMTENRVKRGKEIRNPHGRSSDRGGGEGGEGGGVE